jgi:small-conductance mechanosensitive channel
MDDILKNPLLYHTFVAAIIVAAFVLFTRAVRALLQWLGHRIFRQTETELDDRILEVVLRHVRPLMIVISLHLAVREIRKGAVETDITLHQLLDYGQAVLYVAAVLLLVKVLLGILREIINWYLDRVSGDGAASLKMTLGPLTNKVVDILIGLVALIIILDHFGINIGSLLVSLGVGSLAVALAAQDTLANMIAGFVLLVDRPFRVGDRIEIASGVTGDVLQIGLRSTKLLNFDNNVIIMPNAELVKSRIINFAYPALPMRVAVRLEVAYGTAVDRVRQLLLDLAAHHPQVLADPAPAVHLTALNDSSVQITLTVRSSRYTESFDVESTLREQAYALFLREGIQVPIPQRVVRMTNAEGRS